MFENDGAEILERFTKNLNENEIVSTELLNYLSTQKFTKIIIMSNKTEIVAKIGSVLPDDMRIQYEVFMKYRNKKLNKVPDHDRIIVNNARLTLNKNKRDYLIGLVYEKILSLCYVEAEETPKKPKSSKQV